MKTLWILVFAFVLGCQCPDKVVLRESMYQNMRTTRQLAKDWAEKLTANPTNGKDKRSEIQALSPTQYENLLKADAQFEELVAQDRSRDAFER